MTAHATTAIHQKGEVEVKARSENCHLGLLVPEYFHVLLGCRWLKSWHELSNTGYLTCFLVPCIQQMRSHHVASAPIEANFSASLAALNQDLCSILSCISDLCVFRYAQARNLGLT